MAEFLAMGGYAGFVWSAYAVALLGLGGIVVVTWRSLAKARREAERET